MKKNDDVSTQARQVEAITKKISVLLAGKSPDTQGAVIVTLCAMWLWDHRVVNNPKKTAILRQELLEVHCATARKLTKVFDMAETDNGPD